MKAREDGMENRRGKPGRIVERRERAREEREPGKDEEKSEEREQRRIREGENPVEPGKKEENRRSPVFKVKE